MFATIQCRKYMVPWDNLPLFPAVLFLNSHESWWPQHPTQPKHGSSWCSPTVTLHWVLPGKLLCKVPVRSTMLVWRKWIAAFGWRPPSAPQKPQGDEWALWTLAYTFLDVTGGSETSEKNRPVPPVYPSVKVVLEILLSNSKLFLSGWCLSNTEWYHIFREPQQGFLSWKSLISWSTYQNPTLWIPSVQQNSPS